MRSIDVVETSHSALDAKVIIVVLAQLLSHQLLQTIGILRLCGGGAKSPRPVRLFMDTSI
jgi:hypothetical protein